MRATEPNERGASPQCRERWTSDRNDPTAFEEEGGRQQATPHRRKAFFRSRGRAGQKGEHDRQPSEDDVFLGFRNQAEILRSQFFGLAKSHQFKGEITSIQRRNQVSMSTNIENFLKLSFNFF